MRLQVYAHALVTKSPRVQFLRHLTALKLRIRTMSVIIENAL